MYKTKNLGLNITEIEKDKLDAFSFKVDLGDNFEAIDSKTITHRNITNCLLEVPQDIKLELVDGAITLKAGSKVYVPNGINGNDKLFTTITVNYDATIKEYGTGQLFLYIQTNGGLATAFMSGSTVTDYPETPKDFTLYYNSTTNNIILHQNNSWVTDCSLPIAIVTRSETGYVSIDQVFNGFGYIGSTFFILPGVKYLIPNGRNEDGSLNNINYTTTIVNIHECGTGTYNWLLMEGQNKIYRNAATNYHFIQDNEPESVDGFATWYSPSQNILYRKSESGVWIKADLAIIAHYKTTNSTIDSFKARPTFQAVDYNEYLTKITELETKIQALQAAVEALQG
mgnify:CR=1 FL=1